MKEYLFKRIDGSYHIIDHDCQGRAIEIPEGADTAILYHKNKELYFWKNSIFHYMDETWIDCTINNNITTQEEFLSIWDGDCSIAWKRHTQTEELPFVDDDCVPKLDEGLKLGNFVVDDTLQARQSQYGDFNDVAHTTQLFLDQFALGRLSSVQKESLHMICSKLARIAHGDPNHIDSWHDIAGYATLVVKDIS